MASSLESTSLSKKKKGEKTLSFWEQFKKDCPSPTIGSMFGVSFISLRPQRDWVKACLAEQLRLDPTDFHIAILTELWMRAGTDYSIVGKFMHHYGQVLRGFPSARRR
jgi:hypothetical protein